MAKDEKDEIPAGTVEPELARIHRGIRALNRDFCGALPDGAGNGEYRAAPGDRFYALDIDLPGGTYRVIGSDWLLTIQGRRFTGATVANVRNKWGGPKVIAVPPADPPAAAVAKEDEHASEAKARAFSGIPEDGEATTTRHQGA